MTTGPHPNTAADRQVMKDEAEATERARQAEQEKERQGQAEREQAERERKAKEGPPKEWVPDLTDNAFPPSDPRNRGNIDFKPCFEGGTDEEAYKATGAMLSGAYKLPAGTFDNISGSSRFQYPDLQNPIWRWDATGRVTQWVRP
jgi:hypothetical protein